MATNRVFAHSSPLSVATASTVKSNDPVIIGDMAGVALTNYNADTGETTVDFVGVYNLSVKGVDNSGNIAIAVGDALYYVVGDTPVLSKKTAGTFFGYAMKAVTSGSTATIGVRMTGTNGAGRKPAFVSAEITANGSPQNTAHGLGVVPSKVFAVITTLASGSNLAVTEGTHTSTNAVLTVAPSGAKYKVVAFV